MSNPSPRQNGGLSTDWPTTLKAVSRLGDQQGDLTRTPGDCLRVYLGGVVLDFYTQRLEKLEVLIADFELGIAS
jgi:hypothetical protein